MILEAVCCSFLIVTVIHGTTHHATLHHLDTSDPTGAHECHRPHPQATGMIDHHRRNLVIITDMEPDDRIALAVVAARMSQRVLLLGTTVMNAERKAELARRALDQTPLAGMEVLAGTGGDPGDYPEMNSTKPAREYGDREGLGILDEHTLSKLIAKHNARREKANAFQSRLNELLNQALEHKFPPIDFLVLAPPTDLVAVLRANPSLKMAIGHVHLMSGWTVKLESKEDGKNLEERRSSYNVNMDVVATQELLEMGSRAELSITLYSSHIIMKQFGGSVNRKLFPELINLIKHSKAPGLVAFRMAGLCWDKNLVEHYERLRDKVGPYVGEQFTPSDPLPVIGILNRKLVKSAGRVKVKVILPEAGQPIPQQGYPIDVVADEHSGITLVTECDLQVFREEMKRALEEIERFDEERYCKVIEHSSEPTEQRLQSSEHPPEATEHRLGSANVRQISQQQPPA